MKFFPFLAALTLGAALAQPSVPLDKQVALGKSMANDIERHTPLLRDLAVQSYVDNLTKTIASRANLPYGVSGKVLDTEAVGASATWGYVFITAGMIAHAGSVQELSNVIAHEIGHMAAPPSTDLGTSTPMLFIGGSGGLCTKYQVAAATPVSRAARGRLEKQEVEADRLGLAYGSVGGSTSSGQFAATQEHLAAFYSNRAAPSLKQAQ